MKAQKIALLLGLCLAVAIIVPLTVAAAPDMQPKIPHSLEGRNNCTGCHTVGGDGVGASGGTGMPQNHQGRTSDMCQGCHQPAAVAASSSSNSSGSSSAAASSSSSGGQQQSTNSSSSTGAQQQSTNSGSSTATQQKSTSSSSSTGAQNQSGTQSQTQKQGESQSGKLPNAGDGDFQFFPLLAAAALLLFGGFAMRKVFVKR